MKTYKAKKHPNQGNSVNIVVRIFRSSQCNQCINICFWYNLCTSTDKVFPGRFLYFNDLKKRKCLQTSSLHSLKKFDSQTCKIINTLFYEAT